MHQKTMLNFININTLRILFIRLGVTIKQNFKYNLRSKLNRYAYNVFFLCKNLEVYDLKTRVTQNKTKAKVRFNYPRDNDRRPITSHTHTLIGVIVTLNRLKKYFIACTHR